MVAVVLRSIVARDQCILAVHQALGKHHCQIGWHLTWSLYGFVSKYCACSVYFCADKKIV